MNYTIPIEKSFHKYISRRKGKNGKYIYEYSKGTNPVFKRLLQVILGDENKPNVETISDIPNLSVNQRKEAINKEALYYPYSIQQLFQMGSTPNGILLRRAVEEIVSPTPNSFSVEDCQSYMLGLDLLGKTLQVCQDCEDVQQAIKDWGFLASGYKRTNDFSREKILEIGERLNTDNIHEIIKQELKDIQSIQIRIRNDGGVSIYRATESLDKENQYAKLAAALGPQFEKLIQSEAANNAEVLSDAREVVRKWTNYETDLTNIIDSLNRQYDKHKAATRNIFQDVPFERIGGVDVGLMQPEEIAATFKFKDVFYSGWVIDNEIETHLRGAVSALYDLSDILGIDPSIISLNGRIGLSFGSGVGDNTKAHYESQDSTINITRLLGGGAIAHEWAHALDNILARAASISASPNISVSNGEITKSRKVTRAFKEVMKAIRYVDQETGKKIDAFRQLDKRKDRGELNALGYLRWRKLRKELLSDDSVILATSDFHKDAASFSGRKGYWYRSHELFARAFEAYVEDKLEEQHRKNTYLVSGTLDKIPTGKFKSVRHEAMGEHSQPFPQGSDRKRINSALDKLFEAIRETNIMEKSLAILDKQLLIPINPFEEFLIKSTAHKYISKKRIKGKWVYEYKDDKGNKRTGMSKTTLAILSFLEAGNTLTPQQIKKTFKGDPVMIDGAKNALKELHEAGKIKKVGNTFVAVNAEKKEPEAKKRGRPKGSKNAPKEEKSKLVPRQLADKISAAFEKKGYVAIVTEEPYSGKAQVSLGKTDKRGKFSALGFIEVDKDNKLHYAKTKITPSVVEALLPELKGSAIKEKQKEDEIEKPKVIKKENALKKLPPDTNIVDASGMSFSSWDGKAALVTTSSYAQSAYAAFDPDTLERKYWVRYAIDPYTKKPFKSSTDFLGREPYVVDKNAYYEDTTFRMARKGNSFQTISGGFGPLEEHRIQVKSKDLYPSEVREVVNHYREKKYFDSTGDGLSAADWNKALGMSFDEVQEKFDYKKANAFDRVVTSLNGGRYTENSAEDEKLWSSIKGVFATTNKADKLKFVITRKSK